MMINESENYKLKFKRLHKNALLPIRRHESDVGFDLCSIYEKRLGTGQIGVIHTGVAVEFPEGMAGEIRPRSGLALENGVTILNSPGTVDNGYRGEIKVILINHGTEKFFVSEGMKVAQLVVQEYVFATSEWKGELSSTDRGGAGFGSTGYY